MSLTILPEDQTLAEIQAGRSIARFGDGELRLAIGGQAASQRPDPHLARELRHILRMKDSRLLVAVPRTVGPRAANWQEYLTGKYGALLSPQMRYGSAFITRPDSAPWIDTPEFWARCRTLWAGREVVSVAGTRKSLHAGVMGDAASVREVAAPERDAYSALPGIIEQVGDHRAGPVIICLGAAGTVLAARLALMGIWALDLGHMGMFMRHAGAYRYAPEELISPTYKALMAEHHRAVKKWGTDGQKHVPAALATLREIGGGAVLDYGAGKGLLGKALAEAGVKVADYDPAIPEKAKPPKPADLVICADVLEHVEPPLLGNVIDHICRLARKAVYLVIATRPAKAILSDGRNAHLTVQDGEWWHEAVAAVAGECFTWRIETGPGEYRMWLTRRSS